MAAKTKMLVVTDGAGRILAAAHTPGKPSKMNVGISALSGQVIHEVEVPEELTRLKSGHDFHMALCHAKFQAAKGTFEFPEITLKRVKH